MGQTSGSFNLNTIYQANAYWYHAHPTVGLYVEWTCNRPDERSATTYWSGRIYSTRREAYHDFRYNYINVALNVGGVNIFVGNMFSYGGVTHDYTFSNVAVNLPQSGSVTMTISGDCDADNSCDWGNNGYRTDYVALNIPAYNPYTPPGTVTNLRINGNTSVNVLNKSDNLNLTWSAPSGGSDGISGYHVYYKTNSSYVHIGDTSGTSYSTKISSINNSISRGTTLIFMIVPYNSRGTGGNSNTVNCTFIQPTINISSNNTTATSTKINWNSNILISKVEWKLSNENSYRTYYSGTGISSGSISITALNYNSSYTINIRLIGNESGEQFTRSISITTLDIARIQRWNTEWSVEDATQLTITNPSNLAMQLYLSYNNIELISRTNISLNNGIYTLVLTDSEKNILYTQTASDNNPSFKFILKSYSGGTKIGEDVKNTKITFPTKAWVKINNVWKRALVWTKVSSSWKQSIPWVKVGSTWKRI